MKHFLCKNINKSSTEKKIDKKSILIAGFIGRTYFNVE